MAKPKKAITIQFSSEKARNFFAELVASNLVMIDDIRKSDRKIVDKLFKFYTNVIFRALSKALSNENANVDKRHRALIVGTVLADMQTMIVPIVSMLRKDKLDENLILNPDDLARQCGIIDDTESLQIVAKHTSEGQILETYIGDSVTIPEDELTDEVKKLIDSISDADIVGNS
jgi:hypothetical protein